MAPQLQNSLQRDSVYDRATDHWWAVLDYCDPAVSIPGPCKQLYPHLQILPIPAEGELCCKQTHDPVVIKERKKLLKNSQFVIIMFISLSNEQLTLRVCIVNSTSSPGRNSTFPSASEK